MHKSTTEIREQAAIPVAEKAQWQPIPDAELHKVRGLNTEQRRAWLAAQEKKAKDKRRAANKAARKARRAQRRK